MLNKKGFSLVELLGVLIILSIMGVIVSQIIVNRVNENNKKLENLAKDIIISSARDYVINNSSLYPKNKSRIYCVDYSNLIETQYLNEGMIPSLDEVDYLRNYFVQIKYNGETFDYNFVQTCIPQ